MRISWLRRLKSASSQTRLARRRLNFVVSDSSRPTTRRHFETTLILDDSRRRRKKARWNETMVPFESTRKMERKTVVDGSEWPKNMGKTTVETTWRWMTLNVRRLIQRQGRHSALSLKIARIDSPHRIPIGYVHFSKKIKILFSRKNLNLNFPASGSISRF